eukprot:4551423-Karenia_brevis.AAC.1
MLATGVRVDNSSGESVRSPSEMVMYSNPVTLQPVARQIVVMSYPMSNVDSEIAESNPDSDSPINEDT